MIKMTRAWRTGPNHRYFITSCGIHILEIHEILVEIYGITCDFQLVFQNPVTININHLSYIVPVYILSLYL